MHFIFQSTETFLPAASTLHLRLVTLSKITVHNQALHKPSIKLVKPFSSLHGYLSLELEL